jgi:hypothetical protein
MRVVRAVGGCAAVLLAPSLQGCFETTALESGSHWCASVENTPNRTNTSQNVVPNLDTTTQSEGAPDVALVKLALQGVFVNNTLLESIISGLPETLEFNLGGKAAGSTSVLGCNLEYMVGAALERCTGLNGIHLEVGDVTVGQSQGDTYANIPLSLSTDLITCVGTACASFGACGLPSLDPTVSVHPSIKVNQSSMTAVMKAVPGAGPNLGQWCFEVDEVAITEKGQFAFGDLEINLIGLPISIPSSLLNQVWDNLQLGQVIETLEDQLRGVVRNQLDKMPNLCFAANNNTSQTSQTGL